MAIRIKISGTDFSLKGWSNETRTASAVHPLGRLEGDVTVLKSLGQSIAMTVDNDLDP